MTNRDKGITWLPSFRLVNWMLLYFTSRISERTPGRNRMYASLRHMTSHPAVVIDANWWTYTFGAPSQETGDRDAEGSAGSCDLLKWPPRLIVSGRFCWYSRCWRRQVRSTHDCIVYKRICHRRPGRGIINLSHFRFSSCISGREIARDKLALLLEKEFLYLTKTYIEK